MKTKIKFTKKYIVFDEGDTVNGYHMIGNGAFKVCKDNLPYLVPIEYIEILYTDDVKHEKQEMSALQKVSAKISSRK